MRTFPRIPESWLKLPFAPSDGARFSFAAAPLAGVGNRADNLDFVLFASGLAVLSAGLIVLRAARLPAVEPVGIPLPKPMAPAPGQRALTADEALAARAIRASDRELLLDALAQAATAFYSIAGHLPGDVSEAAVRKADDLRELVWINRQREEAWR